MQLRRHADVSRGRFTLHSARGERMRQCNAGSGSFRVIRAHRSSLGRGATIPATGIRANHSSRNATTGSTRVARMAGTKVASAATPISVIATTRNVLGSLGCTP